MKKKKTKSESDYMDAVFNLGCHVCGSPPQLHHIRLFAGMGTRSPNVCIVPLCAEHHTGEYSIHGSKALFEKIEGTEAEMLSATILKIFEGGK